MTGLKTGQTRPGVLLIQPPIQDFYITRKRTIPYGLASICASLEAQGFDSEIMDGLATHKSKSIPLPGPMEYLREYYPGPDATLFSLFHDFRHFGYSFEHMARTVREKKPFLVGISSLFTAYADQALATAQIIKKWCPQAIVVLGGHHPTVFPEKVLDCPAVDFVIRGEGEIGLPLLCRALLSNRGLEKVPGLGFWHNGKLHINPAAWIEDLSSFPMPLFNRIHPTYYKKKKKAAIVVMTSRGCPMTCSYCSVSATSAHGKFRQRRVNQVIEEIKAQARNRDIGFIDFEDENLTLNRGFFLELLKGLDGIFPEEKPELRAMNGLFPPSLDREMIGAMKTAGFRFLNLSLGSTSRGQLDRFKRPDVRKAHDRVLETAREFNLSCVSYLIAGAMDQPPESSVRDLLFLAQRPTLVGLSIFYPAPGSLDYKACEQLNMLPPNFSLMRSTALPIDQACSRLQSVTLLRLARILNYAKALIDQGKDLPEPRAFDPDDPPLSAGPPLRELASKACFQWFLHDGRIRGVDPKGKVFEHRVNQPLASHFLEGLKKISIMGVKLGPARVF